MPSSKITLKIVGSERDNGLVQFDDFVAFCEVVYKCLRASESIVVGSVGGIRYQITDMKCDSAAIQVQAVRRSKQSPDGRENPKKVVNFFRKTVSDIQTKGKVDPRISLDDLAAFRDLSQPLKHRARRVMIGRVAITEKFTESLNALLEDCNSYEGSVTGLLERINVHNDKNEFVLYPAIPGRQIPCVFPAEMLDKIRAAIKCNVTVSGTLFYRPGSVVPTRVHAQDIDIHPPNDQLPTLFDVRDAGIWDTGNLTALEFVHSLRNE